MFIVQLFNEENKLVQVELYTEWKTMRDEMSKGILHSLLLGRKMTIEHFLEENIAQGTADYD